MLPLVTRAAQVTRLRSRGLSSGLAQTSPKSTSSVSSTSFGAKSPIMRCAGVWSVMLIPLEGLVVTVTTSSQGGGLRLGECLPFQVTPVPPCGGRHAHTVVVMDNRAQVREFLVSRRERISPAQAGLPAFEAMEFPAHPGLTLVVYSAAAATSAADNLKLLASWAATA